MEEKVLVIPSHYITITGFIEEEPVIDKLFQNAEANYQFLKRNMAEYNEAYKQIIPQIVIKFQNEYLLLKRTTKQSEKRLHNKYSLTLGGHINPIDSSTSFASILEKALYRELEEEIYLEKITRFRMKRIGLVNDNSNEVSRVHLGIVYILEVFDKNEVEIKEKENMEGTFLTLEEIKLFYDKLESWSQIILNKLEKEL